MGRRIVGEVQYVEEGFLVTAPLPVVDTDELEDVQSARDHREIAIEEVGVNDLEYPLTVIDRAQKKQQTIGAITLSVGLPHDTKCTHMSRFIEVLE